MCRVSPIPWHFLLASSALATHTRDILSISVSLAIGQVQVISRQTFSLQASHAHRYYKFLQESLLLVSHYRHCLSVPPQFWQTATASVWSANSCHYQQGRSKRNQTQVVPEEIQVGYWENFLMEEKLPESDTGCPRQ